MSTEPPIIKNTLHVGRKYVPISNKDKVHFHFQTWKLDKERVLIDDSRKIGQKEPMVLVIGHKFKLEVWEQIVKMMAVGEVASFKVKKELTLSYPFISKTLRELGQEGPTIKHSCTMTLQTEGIGYKDLDLLIRNPCDLEFIIELLKVEHSSEYEKDLWQLSVEERLQLIPSLREKGNKLYMEKQCEAAQEVYGEAIGILEQLMLRERKEDEEWVKLNEIRVPLLLNYAQCKLTLGDYYSVIEHCSTVLEHDKDNAKALYRRAKAHVGAWNPSQAEDDFKYLKSIEPSMSAMVDKELANIKKLRKEKTDVDKGAMQKLFITDS